MNEKLFDHYKDELNDVITYVELSKEAPDSLTKQVLKDIAREERQHARILHHLLKRAGKQEKLQELEELATQADDVLNEV